MKRLILFILTFLFILPSCEIKKESLKISKMKTEYSENPVGLDTPNPRFSWILSDTMRNIKQSAYRIMVSTHPSKLKKGKADMWNSGWVESDKSVFIEYQGKALQSGKRYFWKIWVKDNNDREIESEKAGYFEMGLLDRDEWKAGWIGFRPGRQKDYLPERPRSVLLRNEFEISSKIKHARAYISGLGSYVLFINGKRIGNDLLTPGWTDYYKRVQYQVYDISENLKQGENAAGIILGNMWWSSGLGWRGGQFYSKGPLRALAQIEVEYDDGSVEIFTTNKTWKGHLSPIVDNSLYHGETYDARLDIPMWAQPGLDDSGWEPVEEYPMNEIILSSQKAPPIKIMDTIVPVSVNEVKPGVYVYDMGFNMVGFTKLSVQGNNGDTVILRFAELLHEDGTVAQENLRSAKATDRYILKGTGEEIWQPNFTYHGFRYVQMEGFPGTPTKENLTGLRFYSSAPVAGEFKCSNEIINSVWSNIMNGQKGNMHSVPTDCPQRDERLGWMGDAQIFAPTSSYNMDMSQFFAKWVGDITDSQHETGYVFDVNPAIVVDGPSKAGWGDAVTVVPMVMYQFYADKRILKNNYRGMKAWVEYMRHKSEDHIYRWSEKEGEWEGYGDWIAVVESPVEPISAAYYFYSTKLLSEAAAIIGKKDDSALYSALADSIRNAFQEKFFNEGTINYPSGTQTANLLPLAFDITPESYRKQIAGNVIKDVEERGKHPSTGFLGTAYLLPTLSEFGAHQLAFETAINDEYPSWGYMVKNGATSMWELWNSDTEPPEGMNSRNHFALGSIGEWYYSHLAGIKPIEPGFKNILINPMPAEGLEWVTSSYDTPYGRLKSSWSKDGDMFHMDIQVPVNTTAEVVIPVLTKDFSMLKEADRVIYNKDDETDAQDIEIISVDNEEIRLKIGSGTYAFTLR